MPDTTLRHVLSLVIRSVLWLLPVLVTASCATRTDLITTDLTRQQGLYVVGYVDRADIRRQLEDQFVKDLATHSMSAYASRHDIDDIKAATPADVIRAADQHRVVAVLVANRIAADGSGGVVEGSRPILPGNPDLQAYYEATRSELDNYRDGDPVFVEVNAFFVDGAKSRRFWTGTTWTFDTASPGKAISGLSETITAELSRVRDELRSYDRPMTDDP